MALSFNELKICEFNNWEVYLHECQCYLGRVYVLHKDERKTDLFDICDDDFLDLREIIECLKLAIKNLFSPDLFNYASLGNVFHRVHIHIIPRYRTERRFLNVDFRDNNWGRNYAPYDKTMLDDFVVLSVKKEMEKELCKIL